MEEKAVYMTTAQVEELQEKVNAIEGLAELRAAIRRWVNYHQAKTEFERGVRDYEDMPKYDPNERAELKKKYPRAAAYLEAEHWVGTTDPVMVRLGSRACDRLIAGDDPAAVLEEMLNGLRAFNVAQEG